jgi:hypothetical protein
MLATHVESILLVTGLATASALGFSLAPVKLMKAFFGLAPADALSTLIARHWGLLIGLVGVLLVYAAYDTAIRVPTLIVAIVEKAAFVLGILVSPVLRKPLAMLIAVADATMATVYLLYLVGL